MSSEMIRLMRCRTRLMLAAGLIILLSIVAVNMLLVSAPVVIQIEGDTFKVIEIPYSYTTKDAYILLAAGLLGGISISQILICIKASNFAPSQVKVIGKTDSEPEPDTVIVSQDQSNVDVILRALEGDERKAVKIIVENGGEILQNELVNYLNFSKAKVSRILMNLEKRNIIAKRKYGLTNHISLADDIRGEIK